jgi:hypothetical protein
MYHAISLSHKKIIIILLETKSIFFPQTQTPLASTKFVKTFNEPH